MNAGIRAAIAAIHETCTTLTWLYGGLLGLAVLLPAQPDHRLCLRQGTFDPLAGGPDLPTELRADTRTGLWIVQTDRPPTDDTRAGIRAAGGRICSYLPHNSYVVRIHAADALTLGARADVRFVGPYHPGYRLEPAILDAWTHLRRHRPARSERYNVVVTDRDRDRPELLAGLRRLGARIDHEQAASILVQASMTLDQVVRAARLDEVLWIDRWLPPGNDMNNARQQGGGLHVEQRGGFTGQGVRGHVYEGLEVLHPDFNVAPVAILSCADPSSHGHCTAGIVCGNGNSHSEARGMAPDVSLFFTNYLCVDPGVSRMQVVQRLVDQHDVMFTTASWGSGLTSAYNSITANADDIVFCHDIPWTQSMANTGSTQARAEAWAKNVFSIGGLRHFDNAEPGDDSWAASSTRASHGPAADGRIKPDLCAFHDAIHCSDRTGAAGFSSGNSYRWFGGTSGATPIVAGHNAIALQMFTDGMFGNTLRVPGGTRFQNRPHFTTLKALQIVNATQYPFDASSTDNRREHQGWGFPSLRSMWEDRDEHVIVDETDVLTQGSGTRWSIDVPPGRSVLKICMTFADPAGNPAAAFAAVNDLSLRVASPAGTTYHGNVGLDTGTRSVPGGAANTSDTVECVFVPEPTAGRWEVDVVADRVAQDGHTETTPVDADYGLVVRGAILRGQQPLVIAGFRAYGSGCPGSVASGPEQCLARNAMASTRGSRVGSATYAIEVVAPRDLTIHGFDLVSQASPAQTIATALRADDGSGGEPGTVLATGTMSIGPTEQWYATVLDEPVAVTAGQRVFLTFIAPAQLIRMSAAGSGELVPYFFRSTSAGARWSGPFRTAWIYRVQCAVGPKPPALVTAGGTPRLGKSFDLAVEGALPATAAALLLGTSDTTWAGATLPLSLAPLGAPGCAIFTSVDALLGSATNATGRLSFTLRTPNHPALLGAAIYGQFAVVDPAASELGVVTTEAVDATIGH